MNFVLFFHHSGTPIEPPPKSDKALDTNRDRPDFPQWLVIISKTLLSPETASPSAQPGLQTNLPDFVPTTAAVMVNTLWFLSLGLSIAVSLIAILAKEWCYSFMTRRTGAKLVQGRLRQKRWDGIKCWKMEEIICMLPLLMHIALLLFAIGLSIYLWNINPKVSLPVVVTTVLTVLYYTVTAFLPLFSKYCPYTTAVVKLFHPLWTAIFKSIYSKALFQMLVMAPAWLILHILHFKDRISGKSRVGDENLESGSNISSGIKSEKTLRDYVQEFEKKFYHRIERMHKDFLIDRFQPGEDETPMDEATSSMLLWMIMNCENPKSVDLALRALAGADLWLPCKIFLHHEIDFHILRKLERCLYVLESPHLKSQERRREELIDDTYLYARALATLLRGAPEKSKTHCVPWNDWVNCMRRIHNLKINDATHPRGTRSRTSRSTDLEFGTLLLEGNPAMHLPVLEELHPGQRERRWEILKQITTAKITIPPSIASVRGLVNVVTGTFLHTPRSPLPLVRLFNAYNINMGNEDATLGHAIGIALTVARFTDPRLAPIPGIQEDLSPSREATSASSSAPVSRFEHAQKVYQKLIVKQPTQRRELADVRSDERSRVTNHGPTFSARNMQFLGLSASSDRDELQGTWPEIYERLQEKCEASVPATKLLSIEVKGAQTNEDEPAVASPRSEPEQPFGITEINPAVQGSSTS
ncbi:unnamed protein product [Rhizoctonia solani]|uniref:DUF6535 domain-containing protein n=1 Tax=Rhizoctonia solani TaxID=456999 RepID=A0A8H3E6E5_9AGAM|nr:unnamed protein product [Rhizoctonia solani]